MWAGFLWLCVSRRFTPAPLHTPIRTFQTAVGVGWECILGSARPPLDVRLFVYSVLSRGRSRTGAVTVTAAPPLWIVTCFACAPRTLESFPVVSTWPASWMAGRIL